VLVCMVCCTCGCVCTGATDTQGDAATATKCFDHVISVTGRVLDEAPGPTKAALRPFITRPLLTYAVRGRLWKAGPAANVAAALGLPLAATSPLAKVHALTTLCFQEGVAPAERNAALDQAVAAMPALEKECRVEVRWRGCWGCGRRGCWGVRWGDVCSWCALCAGAEVG
jgi:hypothetical protein